MGDIDGLIEALYNGEASRLEVIQTIKRLHAETNALAHQLNEVQRLYHNAAVEVSDAKDKLAMAKNLGLAKETTPGTHMLSNSVAPNSPLLTGPILKMPDLPVELRSSNESEIMEELMKNLHWTSYNVTSGPLGDQRFEFRAESTLSPYFLRGLGNIGLGKGLSSGIGLRAGRIFK
jgi:hypothetical protein